MIESGEVNDFNLMNKVSKDIDEVQNDIDKSKVEKVETPKVQSDSQQKVDKMKSSRYF
jgi:hypothetical protein